MELTREQQIFLKGARTGAQEMSPRILSMDDETVWGLIKGSYEKAIAALPAEPTGDGESPAAEGIRNLAGKVGNALTSNTEPPKHTRRRNN